MIVKPSAFQPVRCQRCGAMLFKALVKDKGETPSIEIKCRKCGETTLY